MDSNSAKKLKYVSLVTLTIQNAVHALSIRYSRTREGDMCYSSTVVFMIELVKLLACLILVFLEEMSPSKFVKSLVDAIVLNPKDTLIMAVPSCCYVILNNLLFVAAAHLTTGEYQVTYQIKTLTTALFAIIMLKKKLLPTQWLALLISIAGVILVQLAQGIEHNISKKSSQEQNKLTGFIAIISAAITSGFSGVFFEKVLKTSDVSLWMRNIQLSLLSLPFSLINCYVNDGAKIAKTGFFFGYDWFVIYLILWTSFGGLANAVVIKYADNIIKGFVTSLAIVIGCVCSMYFFEFQLTIQFLCGTCLVILSIFLYGYNKPIKFSISLKAEEQEEQEEEEEQQSLLSPDQQKQENV